MSLDSILNTIIPPAIFIAIGFFIYMKAKKPIDKFFVWVGEKISGGSDDEKYEGSFDIDYQPAGTYNYSEDI